MYEKSRIEPQLDIRRPDEEIFAILAMFRDLVKVVDNMAEPSDLRMGFQKRSLEASMS